MHDQPKQKPPARNVFKSGTQFLSRRLCMITKLDGIRLREFCQFKKEIRVSAEHPVIGPLLRRRSKTKFSARKLAPHSLTREHATKKRSQRMNAMKYWLQYEK